MSKKSKTISYLAVGSIVAAGVFHLIKRKQKNIIESDILIEQYNDNHNNSRIEFDEVVPIDVNKRHYHTLSKQKNN